jgi:hypothetical protein
MVELALRCDNAIAGDDPGHVGLRQHFLFTDGGIYAHVLYVRLEQVVSHFSRLHHATTENT